MLIDCTLDELKVPGFSGFIPPLGSKKAEGESLTSREHNNNIMLPFARQRPFIVTEDSTTSEIEANTLFSIPKAGVSLTLGAGAFAGCIAKIINISGDAVSVNYTDGASVTVTLAPETLLKLYWNGTAWKRSVIDTKANTVDGIGRNLFDVFGITIGTWAQKIALCMAEIRRRCNNNGEIDASTVPDFFGIEIGDYIDGIDMSAIPAENAGMTGQAWNDAYKNNRIVVGGFNLYKHSGDKEVVKNHIVFTFRNIICKKRINPTNANVNGYPASEVRVFMDGSNGDGTGSLTGVSTAAVYNALKFQLSGGTSENYILPIRKEFATSISSSEWGTYSVWLPSEIEVFGMTVVGDVFFEESVKVHLPLYQKSSVYWSKRWNGVRSSWWESSMGSSLTNYFGCFAFVGASTAAAFTNQYVVSGCAPVFCVA